MRLDFQTLEYIIDRLCPSQRPYMISNLEMPDTRVDQLLGQYHAPDYTQQFRKIVEELDLHSNPCPDLSELTVNLVNTDHSLIHAILYLTLDEYRQGQDYQRRTDLCERTRQELMDQHIDETPRSLAKFLGTNLMIVGVTGVELLSGAKDLGIMKLGGMSGENDLPPNADLPTLLIYRNYMDVYLPVTHQKVLKESPITTLKESPILQWFWQRIKHSTEPSSEPSKHVSRIGEGPLFLRRESIDEPDEIRRRELSKHKLDRLQELCELCDLPTTKPGKSGKPIRMTKADLIESLVHHT